MNYCAYMDSEELAEQKLLSSSIKATRPSDADLERWRALLAGVKSEWAKRLDSRRKPGTEALQAWDVEMAKVRGSDKTAPAPGH